MANKKTHKKINKIKLKKNNKSKRKYKKKGAGQTHRRGRRRRTRNQTPSPIQHRYYQINQTASSPQLIIDSDDLPPAEASFSKLIVQQLQH